MKYGLDTDGPGSKSEAQMVPRPLPNSGDSRLSDALAMEDYLLDQERFQVPTDEEIEAGAERRRQAAALPDETPSLAAMVPTHLLAGLRVYAVDHRPVGEFLTACLENDFMQAIGRADEKSLAGIRGVAIYIHNALPSQCHGSPEKVKAWLKDGGSNLPRRSHAGD